jgi:hypothetical protein
MTTLDDQAWNDWADARIKAIVDAYLDVAADETCAIIVEREQAIRRDFSRVRASMMQDIRKELVSVFNDVLAEMGLDGDEDNNDNIIDLPNFRAGK